MKNGILLAGSLLLASIAQAAVVLQDTFDQPAGALTGLAPSTPQNIGDTWIAGNLWAVNGAGTLAKSTGGFDNSAFLPVSLTAGNVYTLTAQINVASGATGNWIGMGFADPAGGFFSGGNYNPFVIFRDTGAIQYTAFPGSPAEAPAGTFTAGVFHDFSIILDTTGAQWTASFKLDGNTLVAPTQFTTNPPDIARVGFSSATITGSVNSITLEAVPEPSTYAIIAGILILGFAVIRRRR